MIFGVLTWSECITKKRKRKNFDMNPKLSVVIPAYNEESRLPATLASLFVYLPTLDIPYEIIVVDDGSRDRTVEIVQELQKSHQELRLLSDGKNRGRGAAVKLGMLNAAGSLVLETDSDGSVAEEAIGRCVALFDADPKLDAVFGSRELPESHIALWQPPLRVFLGYGFLYLARSMFLMRDVTDFTLGFKMFRREAARDIFAHQYDPFFIAEAEIVCVTRWRGYKSREIAVTWTDNKDSRVKPLRDVPRSFKGLVQILLWRLRGRYR